MGNVIMSGIVPPLAAPLPGKGIALNDMTWKQIRAISDAGVANEYFSAGDTKTIVINGTVGLTTFSNLSVDVFIIGINHNSDKEGTNRIHFGIGKINGVDVTLYDAKQGNNTHTSGAFSMSIDNVISGGWKSSHMRKTILGSDTTPTNPRINTLIAALPSDLRTVMKAVTKYSDNVGNASDTASNVTTTTDYLWLLSEFEVFGTKKYANSAEQNYQAQYDYYKAGNSKVKYRHNANTTKGPWWLRSVMATSDYQFIQVNGYGNAGVFGAGYSYGVAPAFAV